MSARLAHQAAPSSWRRPIIAWLVALGLIAVSGLLPAAIGYGVILAACVLLGAVLGARGGDPGGLREHRQ